MWSSKLKDLETATNVGEIHQPNSKNFSTESTVAVYEEPAAPNETYFKEFIGYGIGLTSLLTEMILSHPFLVVRHQCQVRFHAKQLHVFPLTLFPVLQNYVSRQGIFTLWKGMSGALTVRALTLVTENVVSEFLPLPKEVSFDSAPKKIVLHLLLKAISLAACTPFYAASIVEFVQSDIASEPASIISCFVEGFRRFIPFSSGPRLGSITGNIKAGLKSLPIRTSRRLPIWKLIPPVVVLGVGQRIVRLFFDRLVSIYFNQGVEQEQMDAEAESRSRLQRHTSPGQAASTSEFTLVNNQRQEVALQSTYIRFYTDLAANLWASLAVDVLLYPLETIVVRLCVQGTRTLVDNMDTGVSVLPIVSAFDGPLDAIRSALHSSSGLLGLYRGFGALAMQYALQAAFLMGVKAAYERLLCCYSSPQPHFRPLPADRHYEGQPTPERQPQQQQQQQPQQQQQVPTYSASVWQPLSDQGRWNTDLAGSFAGSRENLNPSPHLPEVAPTTYPFRGYSGVFDRPF
uniref:Solute carrier family 25 member 46 n=2 Tax=Schistocephalus solidus TaxID=70667 RepID=A0A0X3PSK3_SCHSO